MPRPAPWLAAVLVAAAAGITACGGDDQPVDRQQEPEKQPAQDARRVAATPREEQARARRVARARRRAQARRRADARERRRRERAQRRALTRSRPENAPGDDCAEGYDPCVPPYPPDVDCAELSGPYTVSGPDPHRLDPDGDGKAC
jgi:hypothetical protein